MTDTSSSIITQPASQLIPVTAPVLPQPAINGSLPDTLLPEEDYTIKCICDFQDDDGNTVLCENCDTWQHIECYYHGKKVPDVHNCADCEPRPLDGKRATERQKRLREHQTNNSNESGDRKTKRPASKSHKKKAKDTNSISEHVNGWSHGRHESNSDSRDQPPPPKRPKTSHRNSGSISSQTGTPTLSHESHRRAGSTNQIYPSPTKSPNTNGAQMSTYSSEFLNLYDNDPGDTQMQHNFHHTTSTISMLSSWLRDPEALRQATGRSPESVFHFPDHSFDPSNWPIISKQVKTDTSVEFEDRNPTWKYLRLDTAVHKDEIVGEVKGHIGLLQDYCLDPANRYQELRHPEPFVFFHPHLPIYIDARKEGTQFRYVRRSCRPNLTMKTYITDDVEYRFCFVAKEEISAGSELTAAWFLDTQIFRMNGSAGAVKEEDQADEEPDQKPIWVSRVLANFGDCACYRPPSCHFASLDLRRPPRTGSKNVTGKRKRAKAKQGISPMSTGHATNSRAGSEGPQTADNDDQADSRSTSSSLRSKAHSRDLTPTSGLAIDAPGFHTSGLSDRERRKIEAAERKFEQLEQTQYQGQRKKKRPSGGSNLNSASSSGIKHHGLSTASLPSTPSVSMKPNYIDASTSRGHTGSPPVKLPYGSAIHQRGSNASPMGRSAHNTPFAPSPLSKPVYTDKGIQCDRDEFDPESDRPKVIKVPQHLLPMNTLERRSSSTFVPPAKRLLMQAFGARQELDAVTQSSPVSVSACPNPAIAALPITSEEDSLRAPSPATKQDALNVEMKDDTPSTTIEAPEDDITTHQSLEIPTSNSEPMIKPPPPPWPSTAAHISPLRQPINGYRATELHVQLPPLAPFSNPSPTTPTVSYTPNSATTNIGQSPWSLPSASSQATLQTPGSSTVAPSPVKKKLSLGDYMSRRSNLAPNNEKPASSLAQSQQQSNTNPTGANVSSTITLPKPAESLVTEAKEHGLLEGSAIEDTPMKEAGDPMTGVVATPSAPITEPKGQEP